MKAAEEVPHPAFELLRKYRSILAAAWDQRRDLAGPRLLADEAAFLPAALSLQRTPVHPAPRRAMWLIIGAFVAALSWSILGQVDIVAVAPGTVVVSDRTKVVQPLEAAVVRAILVEDGDHVQVGQVLVELDPTASGADNRNLQEQRAVAGSEAAQARALLNALASRGVEPRMSAAQPRDQARLAAEWADLEARRRRTK